MPVAIRRHSVENSHPNFLTIRKVIFGPRVGVRKHTRPTLQARSSPPLNGRVDGTVDGTVDGLVDGEVDARGSPHVGVPRVGHGQHHGVAEGCCRCVKDRG